MTRADIHRPSVIKSEEYCYVGFLPHGDFMDEFRVNEFLRIEKLMRETGGRWSGYAHGGSCEVCGHR